METSTLSEKGVRNYIDGQLTDHQGNFQDLISPLNGQRISQVPLSAQTALDDAVAAARKAFPGWSGMTMKERVQIFFEYRYLLNKHQEELTYLVHLENGKTLDEAAAEVAKSIELTEFACSLPQIVTGEVMEVSKGVECRTERKPLGVVASITPFNFPNMVPNWTIPNALVLGNCMIMKPSEKVPLSVERLAHILTEAGLPNGVFNVVNGDKDIVDAICNHPYIEAVSFVGSTKIAQIVYQKATHSLKRCVALGGAKNHLLVLPDAQISMTASNIAASMTGCAGQRCMAASAMVGVGAVEPIIDALCHEVRKIIPGENLGAVISLEAKQRIEGYITEAEALGAKILVDGRNPQVAGKEGGYYVGPTVIDFVTPDMAIAQEEVFGPVIAIMRAGSLDEAIEIENGSNYGNAASVFTQNGAWAKEVMDRPTAGMVGVNIGVPVPREPFSFGGWNESKFGVSDITGKSSVEFWTQLKKTTTKWNPEARINWMS